MYNYPSLSVDVDQDAAPPTAEEGISPDCVPGLE